MWENTNHIDNSFTASQCSYSRALSAVKIIDIGALVYLVVLFSFLISLLNVAQADDREKVSIQLKWKHQFQFAGYYAAKEKGFFDEEGLNVDLLEVPADMSPAEAVLQGRAQYGVGDSGILLQHLMGKKVVLVAQIFQHSPLVLGTTAASGIRTPFELKGKTISATPEGAEFAVLNAMLLRTIGGLSTVKFVQSKKTFDDLRDGKVDAIPVYISDQPFRYARQGVPLIIIDPRDYGIDFYGDNLFTTSKEALNNPERVAKMRRAVLRGWAYALNNPDEIIDIILEKYNTTHTTEEFLQNEYRLTKDLIASRYIELGHYEPSRAQKIAEIYFNLKLAPRFEIKPDFVFGTSSKNVGLTSEEIKWIRDNPEIPVGVDGYWPPIDFVDKNGEFTGYINDYLKAIERLTGLSFKPERGKNFTEMLAKVRRGDLPMATSIVKSPEREKDLHFVREIFTAKKSIFARVGSSISSVEDLNGKTVALTAGYSLVKRLREENPEINVREYPNSEDSLRAVAYGQADAFIGGRAVGNWIIKEQQLTNIAPVASAGPRDSVNYIVVSRNAPNMELLPGIIRKAMDAISAEDKNEIERRWLHEMENEPLPGNFELTNAQIKWLGLHPDIYVYYPSNSPPYSQVKGNTASGFLVDFMKELTKSTGSNIEMVSGPSLGKGIDMMGQLAIDIIPGAVKTPERETKMLFTEPIASLSVRIAHLARNGPYFSISDLENKKVGVLSKSFEATRIKKAYPDVELVKYDDEEKMLIAIARNDIEAAIGDYAVFNHHIHEAKLRGLILSPPLDAEDFPEMDIRIAIRKDFPELVEIFDNAIVAMPLVEKRRMYDRWFGSSVEEKLVPGVSKSDTEGGIFVLRGMGILFVVVAGTVFVAWLIRGRPKVLTIKEMLFVVFYVFASLIVANGVFVSMQIGNFGERKKLEAETQKLLDLTFRTRQASVDSTMIARTYAATTKEQLEKYFREINDIRTGKQAWPRMYESGYWTHVIAGAISHRNDGEIINLASAFAATGASEQEVRRLAIALEAQDKLIELENIAFQAIKGRFRDSKNEFTIEAPPNQQMAIDLLNGEEFNRIKSIEYKAIDDTNQLIERRRDRNFQYLEDENSEITKAISVTSALTVVFSLYVFFLFKRRITGPLSSMEKTALSIGKGDYVQIKVLVHDEIGSLANSINEMSSAIEDRTVKLSKAYEIISQSIDYAVHIQRSILPTPQIISETFSEHLIAWEPRDKVGGDMYWVRPWGEGKLVILGDCTGHGVPGAFMTLIANGALDRAMEYCEPARVGKLLNLLHQMVRQAMQQDDETPISKNNGLDLAACYLDHSREQIVFAGARLSLIEILDEDIHEYKATKASIGYGDISPDQEYGEKTISDIAGKSYYMFSDGITDQVGGPKRRMFGKRRLKRLLLEAQNLPMDEQKQHIMSVFKEYQGKQHRRDDVSLMGFKVALGDN